MIREAATERLLDVASIEEDEWPNDVARAKDWIMWRLIYAGNGAHPHRSAGLLSILHHGVWTLCNVCDGCLCTISL